MQDGFDEALLARLDLDALEKFAHPIVGAKVRVDENPCLFRRHAGVARQAKVTQAIEEPEIHDLGEPTLIRRDLGLGDAENLGCGPGVDVLAARKRIDQYRIVRHVGEHAQLDLRIVGRYQDLAPLGDERPPDLAAELRLDGDVLEIWVLRVEAARGGHDLVEGGVNAASRGPDGGGQGIGIGRFEF